MEDVTEQPEQKGADAEMVDPNKKLDTFTGLNKDGSKVSTALKSVLNINLNKAHLDEPKTVQKTDGGEESSGEKDQQVRTCFRRTGPTEEVSGGQKEKLERKKMICLSDSEKELALKSSVSICI